MVVHVVVVVVARCRWLVMRGRRISVVQVLTVKVVRVWSHYVATVRNYVMMMIIRVAFG